MATIRQKGAALTKLAVFFGGQRKILTKHEYTKYGTVPVRLNIILRLFGTYERMVNCLKEAHPYLHGMEEADKLESAKPAEKPTVKAEPKAVKAAPAPKKPAAKKPEAPAPKEEEVSDGKDL